MKRFILLLLLVFSLYLALPLSAWAQAVNDLDNITIRVIGLDEVPASSMQVIELPEPDLGEMNDINEDIANNPAIESGLDAITDGPELSGGDSDAGANTSNPAP